MTKEIVFGIIRHILTIAGGALVTKGLVDSAGLEQAIGSVIGVLGVVWSIVAKKIA